MKALKFKKAVFAMTFLAVGAITGMLLAAPAPAKRMDLFDAQGNNLMFVTFQYDAANKHVSDSVFFSDSTFTRKVFVDQNDAGFTTKETAVNFTDDTVFKSTFTPSGDKADVQVMDQFGIDQFGSKVTYNKTGEGVYNFTQDGANINQMKYKYNTNGNLEKIEVYDNTGANLLYYALFDNNVGVVSPMAARSVPRPSFTLKGNGALVWNFTVDHAANVKCEALSLAGRRLAVLFNGNLAAGFHSKILRLGTIGSLTEGVYMVRMSVDSKPFATDKFIVQHNRGGAR
jgi:hypothetical protein